MAPPQPILPDHLMHKNKLQEYTQKSGLPLPVYWTTNQGGFPHAPKFRSTVLVDGSKFTSRQTSPNIKASEQDVSRIALESITKRLKDEQCDLIHQDPLFCKSILHEFAIKTNLKLPTYMTKLEKGLEPVVVSSLILDGKTYMGQVAGSKKMAEQLAARAAIRSLLGSDCGTVLSQIIRKKGKHYASFHKGVRVMPVMEEGSSQQLSEILSSVVSFDSEGKIADLSNVGKRRLDINDTQEKKKRRS